MDTIQGEYMKKEFPLVSVLITVYNRPLVNKAIFSILSQTYDNFEIIIVDNASTDNTVDVIKEIRDERIKLYVNDKNYGQTYSMNKGLGLCEGKYIARLDSDDIALPNRLEKQVEFMERNSEYSFCGSWVQMISDNDELGLVVRTPTTDEGFRLVQYLACAAYHPTIMMRKSVLVENSIVYDSHYMIGEDYDMWRQLLDFGKGCNLDEVLVYYRNGDFNDSVKYESVVLEENKEIRNRIVKDLPDTRIEKKLLKRGMEIEVKDKKSLVDVYKLWKIYHKLLKCGLSRASRDYRLVKRMYIIQLYAECFLYSEGFLAKVARGMFKYVRTVKYKLKR